MSKFSEKIDSTSLASVQCKVCRALAGLQTDDPSSAVDADQILADERISTTRVAQAFAAVGYALSADSVRRHRVHHTMNEATR